MPAIVAISFNRPLCIRSEYQPTPSLVTPPSTLPIPSTVPAYSGSQPLTVAASTRYALIELAAAVPSPIPIVSSHNDGGGVVIQTGPRVGRRSGSERWGMTAATSASATAPPNATRHPAETASPNAKPPNADAAGIAACLNPNARPRFVADTPRANARFAAGWVMAFPTPPIASSNSRLGSPEAKTAI